jgi:hypothetical protein
LFVTKRQKQVSALVFRTTIDLAKRHVRATGKSRTNGWSLEFAGICQSRKSSARSQTRDPCHR